MNWRARTYGSWRRLRGDRRLEALRAAETWTPAAVRAEQEARLRALLLHAFEHVPYYRPLLLDSGVVRNEKSPRVDLACFPDLPLLARATIRERARDLEDRRPPAWGNPRSWVSSSGTTGHFIWVRRDRETYLHGRAVQQWFDGWTGHAFGERALLLKGTIPRMDAREWLTFRLRGYAKNETRRLCLVMTEPLVTEIVAWINRRRPAHVLGLAGVVFEIARSAERLGLRVAPLRSVMVSSEPLWGDWRTLIERVFGAPVFDLYGNQEVSGIACECERHDGLHVASPTLWVEILRADGCPAAPGEVGEVVVTTLVNRSMPLVRYPIGDLAALLDEPCGCGRPFPRLRDLSGRTMDAFVRPDGARVRGAYVRQFYSRLPWLEQFQVIQLAPARVHVKLVDHERVSEPLHARRRDLALVAAHVRGVMGPDCAVTFEFVGAIPPEPSGKRRMTLSLVSTP